MGLNLYNRVAGNMYICTMDTRLQKDPGRGSAPNDFVFGSGSSEIKLHLRDLNLLSELTPWCQAVAMLNRCVSSVLPHVHALDPRPHFEEGWGSFLSFQANHYTSNWIIKTII